MARPKVWPPSIYSHPTRKTDRIRIEGQDITLGATGSAESRRNYLRVVQAAENGDTLAESVSAGDTFTVNDLAAWWKLYAPRVYSPGSDQPRHGVRVMEVLCDALGSTPAGELTPKKIRTVQTLMLTIWARSHVNRQIVRVKTIIRRACDEEIIPPEVYQRIACVGSVRKGTPGTRETMPRTPTDRPALDKVIPEVPAPAGAMLDLLWHSGARPGEITVLRTCDVEQRSPMSWVYRPQRHKGAWRGHERVIAFGPQAIAVLRPWLRPGNPERLCFETITGKRWRTSDISRAVREACERVGVKFTPYQLRHAFKRRAIAAGGIAAAMAALGQSSSEAFDRYDQGGDFGAACQLAREIG